MILMLIIDEKSLPTTSLSFILLSDNPHHQAVGWSSWGGHPATWSAQGFLYLTLLFYIWLFFFYIWLFFFIFDSSFLYLIHLFYIWIFFFTFVLKCTWWPYIEKTKHNVWLKKNDHNFCWQEKKKRPIPVQSSEVRFVPPVTAGRRVNFLPAVLHFHS